MKLAKIVFSISLNRILSDKITTNGFSLIVWEKWAFEIQSYVWNKIARTSPYREREVQHSAQSVKIELEAQAIDISVPRHSINKFGIPMSNLEGYWAGLQSSISLDLTV